MHRHTITDAETPGQWDQLAQLQLDGGAPVPILNWNFREYFLGASLAPGNHTVRLTAWDLWHNQVTLTTTVYLDNTPPTASLTVSGPPKQPLFHVDASDASGISAVEIYDGSEYPMPAFLACH